MLIDKVLGLLTQLKALHHHHKHLLWTRERTTKTEGCSRAWDMLLENNRTVESSALYGSVGQANWPAHAFKRNPCLCVSAAQSASASLCSVCVCSCVLTPLFSWSICANVHVCMIHACSIHCVGRKMVYYYISDVYILYIIIILYIR